MKTSIHWHVKLIGFWLLTVVTALMSPAGAAEDGSKAPVPDRVMSSQGDLLIYPLHHATLALRSDDFVIYVDPIGGAGLFQDIPKQNLILITHEHSDHLSAKTIEAVRTENTVIVAPEAVQQKLVESGVEPQSIQILANGETAQISGVEIKAVPMYNTTEARLQFHPRGRGNGYVLNLAGTRVYISGDTEDTPEMRGLKNIDVAFVCMNLPFTTTAAQAADAVLEMEPRIVYPYHYHGPEKDGWQNPEKFKSLVEAESNAIEVRVRDWYAAQ